MLTSIEVPFGDLRRQHAAMHAAMHAATARVIASGWYVLGPEVRAFEAAFAAACGVADCVGVANGTEALQLALAALGVAAGDEVITVANASVYQTIATLALGARPVYVDVDPVTLTMDPTALAAAFTPRTRAVIVVHLYGQMADMDAISDVARRHGVPVVEDAAQAHAARWRGRSAGSYGNCGCFSFYPTKNLGALGDGGAIVTDDPQLAERLRRLRQYGWERKYETRDAHGMNSRLDELQAAVLHAKLSHLPAWTERRRAIAARYTAALADTGLTLPAAHPAAYHVYHLYVVRHPQRDAVMAALRQAGIGCEIHYPAPAYAQPIYRQLAPNHTPNTDDAARQVLSLPLFPELTDDEVAAVIAATRAACARFATC
jgi:dTDP-4-amino-4,6-dideoxygalactose transaminase